MFSVRSHPVRALPIVALLFLALLPAGSGASGQQRLYLASPLGFSEEGRYFKDKVLKPKLIQLGFEVLDPWVLTDATTISAVLNLPYGARKRQAWRKLNPEIGRRNQAAIDRSSIVLAVLDGTDVDSGTAAEIGYAFARDKPILGYRGDLRLSADNEGSVVNLQVEYFIRQSGGDIITTIDSLSKALARVQRARQ